MKLFIGTLATLVGAFFVLSVASANPGLLPKHPGYPSKDSKSPVTGQSLANDPGQTNLGGDQAAVAASGSVKSAEQHLEDMNNARIAEKTGAGQLPKVTGPQIKIAPPVTSATKADASLGVK